MDQVIYQLSEKGMKALKDMKLTKAQDYLNMALVTAQHVNKSRKDLANIHYYLGLAYLSDNVYDWGFSNYNFIDETSYIDPKPFFNIKEKLNESSNLQDKRILIYNLVSIDYLILFCRYIPKLIKIHKPRELIIEVPEDILPLLSRILYLKECTLTTHASPTMFDSYMEISSIPLFAGVCSFYETCEQLIPYIFPREDLVEKYNRELKYLTDKCQMSVLLNWDIINVNYIKEFTEMFPTIKFICVQSFDTIPDINNIIITKHIKDMETLTSLIPIVKMTITTNSLLAHVAAAMGKKVLLLLEKDHEWIWNNPYWYPNIIMFKQRTQGDWMHVFKDIASYLKSQI